MAVTGGSNKRKKFHDKDKYYKLAKEQGLRSRAAFKLSQINRQFPVLEKAKAVLDLCAAPGGWTQVAARTCKEAAQIVAVDILPIRKFHNHRNVTTLVGDITTDKCKADIKRQVKNLVDLVLHDGAPNIGASYDKDAYEQTELSVHALKCATQHLKHNGTFVTKIYRSRDYASYQWVVKQLFQDVSVFKPKSSRSQSAEIYIICQGYLKPDKIDPRLLDPKHIFEMVEGDTTVANAQGSDSWNVFHKSWDKQKRHRDGYDMEEKDFTMRKILPVSDFLLAPNMKDAIKLLSQCTGFQFQCTCCEGETKNSKNLDKKKKAAPAPDCKCRFFLHHPLTTNEIKECATDLKVLNKGDFKGLLIWREKMEKVLEVVKEREKEAARGSDESDDDSDDEKVIKKPDMDDDDEEAQVQGEIAELRLRKQRERKKLKKKDRAKMAKKRRHAALGMDLNAIDVPDHDQVFSLATLTSKGDLELVSEVNLDQVNDEELFGEEEESDEDDPAPKVEKDEDTGYSYRLDRELDTAYDRYLSITKDGMAKSGTKMAKRSKKLQRQKLVEEAQEDQDIVMTGNIDNDTKTYAEMLQGPKDSDDEDSVAEDHEEEDDGFDTEPMTPEEHAAANKKKQQKANNKSPKMIKAERKGTNPLIHEFPDEPVSIKTARWFSNPLFAALGEQAEAAAEDKDGRVPEVDAISSDEDNEAENSDDEISVDGDDEDSQDEEKPKKKAKKGSKGLDANDVLASMPKTDKQIRHEKRLKALERNERRQVRKAKILGETEGEFDLAPAQDDEGSDSEDEKQLAGLSDEKKRKILEARALIKAGMGAVDDSATSNKFEVVEADRPLPSLDARKYDSDNEEYDSDDYARTMALGTMMLRRSKAKALVDASYNRFSWNDPTDLPEWFVDDENRHYRPQLPVPAALLEKMKEKMLALSTKPIAKVAEARARKNRNATSKLAAAKKKAQLVANSSEMSESMKLKSISKALRGADNKRPGKTYVVAKKGGGTKGGKGMKVVDKRLKNDKRALERSTKTKKNGKKGGLTGGKQRRHHK